MRVFDPGAKTVPGKAQPALFRCDCGGTMYNYSSRLAMGMGVLHYKCDRCSVVAAWSPYKEDGSPKVPAPP